jgi:hypothetical protein
MSDAAKAALAADQKIARLEGDKAVLLLALNEAPRPTPNLDLVSYMDWYFQVRGAALENVKEGAK